MFKSTKLTFNPTKEYCFILAEFNEEEIYREDDFSWENDVFLEVPSLKRTKNISMIFKNKGEIMNVENLVKCIKSTFSNNNPQDLEKEFKESGLLSFYSENNK